MNKILSLICQAYKEMIESNSNSFSISIVRNRVGEIVLDHHFGDKDDKDALYTITPEKAEAFWDEVKDLEYYNMEEDPFILQDASSILSKIQ